MPETAATTITAPLVEAGGLVFIPPKTGHAIRNVGDEPLIYVSATSPPFDRDALERPFRYA